jgi:hypothetical protein
MQRTQQQTFTRDDAFKLTEKLIRKGTPNYIMRDALIERGISAYVANEVITEVRRVHLNEVYEEPRPTVTQLVMIVIAIIILVMVFFVLVNPVS